MSIVLTLPIPPSVNALYGNNPHKGRKGRYKTKAYTEWIAQADKYLLVQKRSLRQQSVSGPLSITFRIATSAPVDVSNIQKAAEDYLVSREITPDDRHNCRVTSERSDRVPPGMCEVEIREVEGA
jgi:Holliday junction resolvase RusA-like endonuclease